VGEVVEDRQRPLPVGAGVIGVARRRVRLADAGEQRGFPVAVAEVAEQGQRVAVPVERQVVVAEAVVDVAEAV
jgi:hypothetical protein